MTKNSGFIINGQIVAPPRGIIVTNYIWDGEARFKHKGRNAELTNFVLHETAGRTKEGCVRTLLTKGYGVQLILDRDGAISCHGDLALDQMTHGNQLNAKSIGVEVINPYAPSLAKGMNIETVPAKWWTWCPDKQDKRYVLPTAKQMDTLKLIVPWLCLELNIPYEFPTKFLNAKHPKIPGWFLKAKPGPGVVAHGDYSSHADGRYLLETLIEDYPS